MNSNATSQVARTVRGCEVIPLRTLDHTTQEAYGWLVFLTVISLITCPITTGLNTLIMIAVKTKHRVKTKSNIALACLSSTDAVMGVIGQPLSIFWVIAELQGNTSSTYCVRIQLARMALRVLGVASLFHLAMVYVERYIVMKHSLKYETLVTETRSITVSAVLWIITILLQLPIDNDDNNYVIVHTGIMFLCIAAIFFCQVVPCFETRRHEKEIATQQVSVEVREKFVKEKKAFKLTTTILFFLMLSYLPLIASRLLVSKLVITSVNSAYFAFFTGVFTACSNSLLNPIIYCVRIQQFRVALKEIVLRKSNIKALN
ncbi:unnamed protein product [Porites lobata]|uniref:G-protein coupled receptors family 1 profile domain-containing protein n=1 Tax=Porites lobata TaxID=104759 RepID=A0ABN8NCX6_9CNID|nr:unnamed protein product [Porites lobata]